MKKLYKLSKFAKLVDASRSDIIKWIREAGLELLTFIVDSISQNQNMR